LLAAAIDDQTLLGEILDCLANIFIGYDFGEFGFHINCPLLLWIELGIGFSDRGLRLVSADHFKSLSAEYNRQGEAHSVKRVRNDREHLH
jgi:hypothetical protein